MLTRAALVIAIVLVVAPAARADVSGEAIVSYVNAQRAAHGIPGDIAHDPVLSDGCAKHDVYGATNGILTHDEDPAMPGYTDEGAQAGRTSVIYSGGTWTAARNPFETAPFHLHQLLAPRIDRMGAAQVGSYGCATTLASRSRPAPAADITYTYPADGAAAWPPAQVARESPQTPGEMIGIPAGTETGPYLYVMFDGPDLTPFEDARATQATVTGPDGPVDVAVLDDSVSGFSSYVPPGLELIPRQPLKAGTTYTVSIAASVTTQGGLGSERAFAKRWSFTTGARDNHVHLTGFNVTGRTVEALAFSVAPGAHVDAVGPGMPASVPVDATGTAKLTLDADGTWTFCLRSGGGDTGYASAEDCADVPIEGGADESDDRSPGGPPPNGGRGAAGAPALRVSLLRTRFTNPRTLTVGLRCSARCELRVSGTIRAKAARTRLRAHTARRANAGPATIRFRLSRPVARSLRSGARPRLDLRVRAAEAAGTTRSYVFSRMLR